MNFFIQNNDLQEKVAIDFCKLYYGHMTTGGFNSVLYLFSPTSTCTLNNDSYTGAYNTLIKFGQDGIRNFGYHKVSVTFHTSESNILINVSGHCCSNTFWNTQSKWIRFNETFLLASHQNNFYIKNHILKLN
jgi:hypothetical protein